MTAKAAVPRAVQEALRNVQPMPGHVFSLYLPFWREGAWRKDGDEAKRRALLRVGKASKQQHVGKLANELRTRQRLLAEASGALTIEATSASPFVTGMGEEHAVENGFAFLSPYGLPYLAGSGVKGVIRRAAEELAAGLNPDGTQGWTFTRVMWLFGYEDNTPFEKEFLENEKENEEAQKLLKRMSRENKATTALDKAHKHFAGALSFWDVIIKDKLDLDILTPHYSHYYQGNEPPHDAGQPQPNPFLVVAPGATFNFHIACAEHRLPESLKAEWRDLVQAAFDHAFEWGGFGAKTAVGYGVLQPAQTADSPQATGSAHTCPQVSSPATPASSSPFSPGQRVLDTDSREIGIIMKVHGDIAIVDFDGVEDKVPLDQLEKV